MKSSLALAALAVLATAVKGQILASYNLITPPAYHLQPGVITDVNAVNSRGLAHPAVVENAASEAQLPPELLNPFYKNPAIAAGLAKESWFGRKEFPVYHREADKISRAEILKIVRRIENRRR